MDQQHLSPPDEFAVPAPESVEAEAPAAEGHRHVQIQVPARHNPTLGAILERVNADDDLYAIWRCANVNAVDRLGMSDHGPVHVQIVANIGLRLFRLLVSRQVVPSAVQYHQLTVEDAEVIVVLACLLHDVGMSVHRDDHERFSVFIAQDKLRELLGDLYPTATRRVMISEILHAIIAHRADGRPLTLEAGIVRVADALDMAKGRSRIPFEAGKVNIHSVSAAAIDRVLIGPGESRAIRIAIHMNNSAGIFQLDGLLREKLHGSGLEPYVEVVATTDGETEKRLITEVRLNRS
ncbi:MAG TPA: HD domain-containing protein [Chloroflexota bacterium]|nr:HD domain-containing protein [Chloroflexota bacterium]